jgi:hypothetical protein
MGKYVSQYSVSGYQYPEYKRNSKIKIVISINGHMN